MSKIDDLIAELCPDGVDFVLLYEVAQISNGKDHKSLSDGEIPVYGSGGIMRYANRHIYDKESVLIPRKGSIGNIFYVDTPFWTVDTIFYTKINVDKIIPKYLYYYLLTQHLEDLNIAGGVPSLTKAMLDKVKIPVPPLTIQQEIVRILDKFTTLEAELEAELEARKEQYNYYRNGLFDCGINVERKSLGEIATDMFRGAGIKREQVTEDGTPCVRYGEIYTTYNISFDTCVSHTDAKKVPGKKYFEYGDILFAITGEKVDEIAKSCVYVGHEKCLAGGDIVVMKHNQNPKYIAYALSTTDAQMQKSKGRVKSKVVHSNVPALKEIKIPITSLEEQERVVAILDRFDTLVNDITQGLPAEIEARKKQYEYYRDKLLTFKEKVS